MDWLESWLCAEECLLLFWRTESGSLNPLPVVYDGLISESRGSGSLTHLHKHPHTLGRHTDIHRNKKLKIGLSKESLNVWIIFHVELDERTKQQAKTHSSSNTAFILTHITSVFTQKWILDEYPRLAWYWLKSYCSMFDTYKCWLHRCFHRYIWQCLQVSGQSQWLISLTQDYGGWSRSILRSKPAWLLTEILYWIAEQTEE